MVPDQPTPAQVQVIDEVADSLYELLHARAQSIGILDIALEVNDWHVDVELMFSTGPDLGLSLDAQTGTCRYCELLEGDQERWLDEQRDGLDVLGARGEELANVVALEVLDGLLAARRPLLRRDADGD
jgi:hypothetical protein